MRFDNPIYDHEFNFPDIAEFPDVRHEPRFVDTPESNKNIEILRSAIKQNDVKLFVNTIQKFNIRHKSLRGGLIKKFKFYSNFEISRIDLDIKENKFYSEMKEQGVFSTFIDTDELQKICTPFIEELQLIPDRMPPLGEFDRGMRLNNNIRKQINQIFQKHGILDTVSKYNKSRPLQVAATYLHYATPRDNHWKQFLYDCKTVTKTTHMHMDPDEDVMKGMIYLNEVDENSGAFSYVPTSNRWIHDEVQNLFGRAISVKSYCDTPEKRAHVFNLPRHLRISHNFGRTLLDTDPQQQMILDKEKYFTSNEGNCVIFDPYGMHRGSQCKTGNRIAIQVLMK